MMAGISLWLDDERDPSDPVVRQLFGAVGDELWVKTASEAIEVLKGGRVEMISLDHDLGTVDNGMTVAAWIEEQAFLEKLPRIKWKIHSQNVVGVENMKRALKKADRYWG